MILIPLDKLTLLINSVNHNGRYDMKREGLSKEQIITLAINLIEERKSVADVNLREIARRAGCSAANIYNYYGNFDELLRDVQLTVFRTHLSAPSSLPDASGISEPVIRKIVKDMIDFAIAHPGLYRLMHLEGAAPDDSATLTAIRDNRSRAIGFIRKLSARELDDDEAYTIAKIFHGYLHGEICRLISNRVFDRSISTYRKETIDNAVFLIRKLTGFNLHEGKD